MDDVNENARLAEAGGSDNSGNSDDDDIDLIDEDEPKIKRGRGRPPKSKELEAAAPRMRKPIEIRSGLLKDKIFCTFTYDHNLSPTATNACKIASEVPIHPDMAEAYKAFIPHLAIIFQGIRQEDLDLEHLPQDEHDPIFIKLSTYDVTAFKLVEYDDAEAIILIGSESLPTGEARLETPPITFSSSRYSLAGELRIVTDAIIFETEEYLHGRKKADDVQGSLF